MLLIMNGRYFLNVLGYYIGGHFYYILIFIQNQTNLINIYLST